jgi:hypothetical protein
MKRTLIALCLLISGSVWARDWQPFVGVIGKLDFVMDGSDLSPRMWWVERFDKTSQFDVGVRRGKHELYLAYSLSNSRDEGGSYYTVEFKDSLTEQGSVYWNNHMQSAKWLVLGYRYWPLEQSYSIVPVLGAAVESGWVTNHNRFGYMREQYEFNPVTHEFTRTVLTEHAYHSNAHNLVNLDGLLETGVAVRIYKDADILTLAQIHTRFAQDRDGSQFNAVLSCAAQLRYTFGR